MIEAIGDYYVNVEEGKEKKEVEKTLRKVKEECERESPNITVDIRPTVQSNGTDFVVEVSGTTKDILKIKDKIEVPNATIAGPF
jgi:hypothetical protein